MALSRRTFLSRIAASGVLATGQLPLASFAPGFAQAQTSSPHQAAYVSTLRQSDGQYAAAVIDHAGNLIFQEHLDDRGHATAITPNKKFAVVFARRPGRFALVLDLVNNQRHQAFSPSAGHHFYGHGFFSPDGKILYATENDYENERGIIGIYDTENNFARIGQHDSYGIGPHEAILLSDGITIAISNGGIVTHPDYPRQKLNLPSMEPQISYIDRRDGKLISQSKLPSEYTQLSLRHISAAKDHIWIGGQFEGDPGNSISLVATHCIGEEIKPVSKGQTYLGMKQYIGSVSTNANDTLVATSAPKGNKIAIWNSDTRELVKIITHQDAGGVAPNGKDFTISDGQGNLWQNNKAIYHNPEIAWDNHLSSVS
ncbi:DUF1513 domain-containing protein [Kiloniella majae]|uniref:DUF1513 domain-containing protein n=1 Tax=Kiloniella majae TaxID=1938558 RepID=UPI000A279674|nr:DUF1513 domain-containing protein [Kiloniella majae]